MIVSIDDLSPEAKKILTSWGEAQNIQVKELRECEANLFELKWTIVHRNFLHY
jgi:hypothetical protein